MIAALILLSLFLAPPQTNPPEQSQTASPQQIAAPPQSPRSYRIGGGVVDSISGTPVPHVQVSISPSSGDGDDQTLQSDDGTFSFDSVEPGKKYRLDASAPGYVPESYNQHRGFSSAIAVGDGFDSEHLVFRLHRQAVIYGVVTDERGEPVRHAQVMLLHQTRAGRTPSGEGMRQTNDLGEYRFPHLLAGKYFVMVQARPWYAQSGVKYARQTADAQVAYIGRIPESATSNPLLDVVYPLTFYPSATDEHEAVELDLTPGEQSEADIALAPVPSVHIRVTNLPTDPKAQIGFQVNQSAFGASMGVNGLESAQISPGEFEISGLPPGNASLVINQFGSSRRTQSLQADFSVTQSIDASAAAAAANVSGVVVLPDAPPPSLQGSVWLIDDRGANFSARIHNDGAFSFESAQLQPGTYRVRANINASRGQDYVQQVSGSGAKISGREITIESGGTARLTITIGHGTGEISGVATLEGRPLGGAMILLVPESGQDVAENRRMDQSDTDGTFHLGSIIPGKYLLLAIQNGWDLDWATDSIDGRADNAASDSTNNATNLLIPQTYRDKTDHIIVAPGQSQNVTLAVQPATTPSAQPTTQP